MTSSLSSSGRATPRSWQSTTTGRGAFANFGHFFKSAFAYFAFQPPLSHKTGDGGDNAENDEKEYEFCHV